MPESPGRNSNSSRRHRHAGRTANLVGSVPAVPSPLRASEAGPGPSSSRRRALARGGDGDDAYFSPTDTPTVATRVPSPDALEHSDPTRTPDADSEYGSERSEESIIEVNPPTPNLLDISLGPLRNGRRHYFGRSVRDQDDDDDEGEDEEGSGSGSGASDQTARPSRPVMGPARVSPPPPGYAPLDPNVYSGGLPNDLPQELINQAIAAMSDDP
jgi:hypothetical protein